MEKGKSFEITQEEVLAAYKCVKANIMGPEGSTRGVEIPKKNGKTRLLGIPTIEDRIAQMVVRRRLEPLVEPVFLPDSYGYRPNKSAIDAVGTARERCWKMPWVIEFDIKGLFDHINHEKLMSAVKKHTQEKWVLLYTERFLEAPMILPNGEQVERTKGTPQGGVISPVLANLFLRYAFDRWMTQNFAGCLWERCADDGLIHCDEWIRRRVRMCIWKQWRKIRTRYDNLTKLGTADAKAWEFANTRKGYWRISNSPILSCTLTKNILLNWDS